MKNGFFCHEIILSHFLSLRTYRWKDPIYCRKRYVCRSAADIWKTFALMIYRKVSEVNNCQLPESKVRNDRTTLFRWSLLLYFDPDPSQWENNPIKMCTTVIRKLPTQFERKFSPNWIFSVNLLIWRLFKVFLNLIRTQGLTWWSLKSS